MASDNQDTQTSDGFDENEGVVDEKAAGEELDSIDVSSDWVNRIDYNQHTIGS